MHQCERTARVYVYDVAHIVAVLENQQTIPEVMYGYLPHDVLIDQFFAWALHSFEFLGIRDYWAGDLTGNARRWFALQEPAKSMLYHLFNVELQYAGCETIVVRRRNTLWLFVIV